MFPQPVFVQNIYKFYKMEVEDSMAKEIKAAKRESRRNG